MDKLSPGLRVFIGISILLFLFNNWGSDQNIDYSLIWKAFVPQLLITFARFALFILALRLLYGKLIHDGEDKSLILRALRRIGRLFTREQHN